MSSISLSSQQQVIHNSPHNKSCMSESRTVSSLFPDHGISEKKESPLSEKTSLFVNKGKLGLTVGKIIVLGLLFFGAYTMAAPKGNSPQIVIDNRQTVDDYETYYLKETCFDTPDTYTHHESVNQYIAEMTNNNPCNGFRIEPNASEEAFRESMAAYANLCSG